MSSRPSVLISTLPPYGGGVPAKTRLLCRHLVRLGYPVTLAYYATFAHHGDLSVPCWRLPLLRPPRTRPYEGFDHLPAEAMGSWLPELEFPYHMSTARWESLIEAHNRHVAVGGTVLVSNPFRAVGRPHLVWFASSVAEDRRHRRARMPLFRRLIDGAVIQPALFEMERKILAGPGLFRGVSRYACDELLRLGLAPERVSVMPIPTDPAVFFPPSLPAPPGVVGFAARFEDPRKNLPLLLEAVGTARSRGTMLRLRLVGADPSARTRALVSRLGLEGAVEFVGELPEDELPDFYRSLDLFAIPSGQEGLCISGIEAMAAGVPVVSTRCGGPEDYVRDGETGLLVDHDPAAMAAALRRIAEDRPLRARMGEAARSLIVGHWSPAVFEARLAEAWRQVWNEDISG